MSLWLLCFSLLVVESLAAAPEVTVTQGRLQGKYRVTKSGRSFSAFEGIPFAEPPLQTLRFAPPVPARSWNGTKEATQIHNICPQRDIYRRATLIEGHEDCLYLNVYTPQLEENSGLSLPVMIFFHGGGWLCGGGNFMWYGPGILVDHDVVLVVTNYRLGALGFISTGDAILPGNLGMKDQNLAIKWVRDNIKSFGGDPEEITLFGESAGGASVNLHMMSPLSKGMFKRGISQSGTAHTLWALSPGDQAKRHAKILGGEFACNLEDSKELVECLRKIPAYDIIAKDKVFMKWDIDPMIPFKPVIEPNVPGAFLVEHPVESLKNGRFHQVPWITGLNSDDGAIRAAGIISNPHLLHALERDFEKLISISLLFDETSHQAKEIGSKIKNFYLKGKKFDESIKQELVDVYTDGFFLHGLNEAVRLHLKYSKTPIFYYIFGYRGSSSFTEIFGDKVRDYGVCHADELQYLFPLGDGLFPDKPPTQDDGKMAKILSTLWVNFAKTGNPTPNDTDETIPEKWLPVQTTDSMDYLDINLESFSMKTRLFDERAKFWTSLPLYSKYKINQAKDEL